MRKIILLLAFTVANFVIQAQVKTPQPSPKATVDQVVGLTNVEIVYSRPSMKSRVIFGGLVPFDKLWRTGANENTTITFSEDVSFAGKELKKGKYALFSIPKADVWEVIFYSDTENWGTPEKFDESKVALRLNAKTESLNRNIETFTINISALENDSAQLELSWEKTVVALKFDVPTQKTALASIEKTLAGPSAGDYFSAGQYYFQSNNDLSKALEFVNRAVSMTKVGSDIPYWYQRQKSLIQAKMGDKKSAIETAKLSLEGAAKKDNQDYVKMNTDSIAEWSKK
jgi:Protein of unknown function (DUF2911)